MIFFLFSIRNYLQLYVTGIGLELEEGQGAVPGAGVRADGPLATAIHVLPAGADHGAAPGQALVLPTKHPLSAPRVGHTLELEGEDALLANSRARGSGAARLKGVGVD